MDCVTTRLQMEIGMFFLSLPLKNARKFGEILFGGPRTEKKFRNFPEKM